ncbi:MAG: hypothetical protein E7331_10625 [Clostridiales bacterium]|nr:hypothetical protein [Clostridiales bacterium]
MKKPIALLLCLVMCLAALPATAESVVEMDTLTMNDGFTFAVPANWVYRNISDQERQQDHLFLVAFGTEEDLMLICTMEPVQTGVTLAARRDQMLSQTGFCQVEIIINEKGAEVLLFRHEDGMLGGYEFLLNDNTLITFLYGCISDGRPLSDNPFSRNVLDQGANSLCFLEK